MALLCNAPMVSEVPAWFQNIEAMGVTTGLTYPGRVEIIGTLHTVCYDTDTTTSGGKRAELRGPAEANAERWYVFSVMVAEDWPTSGEYLVMQIHDTPDGGESPVKPPNLAIHNSNGIGIVYVPISPPSELAPQRILCKFNFPKGVWKKIVIHSNWGTTSAGFLEVIVDGRIVGKEWSKACGYADATGPYFKIGVYDYVGNGGFGKLEAWYKDVSVWSTAESYLSVIGSPPSPSQIGMLNVVTP